MIGLGWLTHDQGESAEGCFAESLQLFRKLNDPHGTALALQGVGNSHTDRGDMTLAVPCFEEARQLMLSLNDLEEYAWATGHLGKAMVGQGRWEEAEALFGTCITTMQQIGHHFGEEIATNHLLDVLLCGGKWQEAHLFLQKWIERIRTEGNASTVSFMQALTYYGETLLCLEAWDAAEKCFAESFAICQKGNFRFHLLRHHQDMALLFLKKAQPENAREHLREGVKALQDAPEMRFTLGLLQVMVLLQLQFGPAKPVGQLCRWIQDLERQGGWLNVPEKHALQQALQGFQQPDGCVEKTLPWTNPAPVNMLLAILNS